MSLLYANKELDQLLWDDFPQLIDTLAEKCASVVFPLRQAVADIYTKTDVGVYWNPAEKRAGLMQRPRADDREFQWCLQAVQEKVGAENVRKRPLVPEDLQGWWVKVAYSPTLRRLAELLQFVPSKDIPGFGGRPIASTIASGLLGAGLGYGGGAITEWLTPPALRRKGRLRRSGAITGAIIGAGIGAVPGLINLHQGRSFNDKTLWDYPEPGGFEVKAGSDVEWEGRRWKAAVREYLEQETAAVKLASLSTIGGRPFSEEPLIHKNELGQVLWGTRADPQTTAMTMGVIHGADRFPDPRAMPGTTTPHQVGLLGLAMGAAGGGLKGYLTGRLVGTGLGALTGMPESTQKKLEYSGAALGAIRSLTSQMFQ